MEGRGEHFAFIMMLLPLGLLASSAPSFELDHRQHLSKFERLRNPLEPNLSAWKDAREYLQESFLSFDLNLETQDFETQVANHQNALITVKGENMIAESLSPAGDAPVILIGTYYDSTLLLNPLMENGASLASLLETARHFQNMKREKKFHQNVTVLFVAFDLNVKHYVPAGPGVPGASFFVKEWLSKHLSERKFLGAVLLDSISNFNFENESQYLTPGFEEAFPSAFESIAKSGRRGNFLAAVSRVHDANEALTQRYHSNYNIQTSDPLFTMEELLVADGVKISSSIKNFLKRAPITGFWTHSPPLPAMLLTDMGFTRKDADREGCQMNCSLDRFWSDKRQKFVEATTLSSINMLLSYQTMINGATEGTTEQTTSLPEVPVPTSPSNKCSHLVYDFYLILGPLLVVYMY